MLRRRTLPRSAARSWPRFAAALACLVGALSPAVPTPTAQAQGSVDAQSVPGRPGNLLFIVADDVGVDMIGQFGAHPAAPPTPNLDQLCAEGVSFVNAFADPICSPTRTCLLTGRFGVRAYIGRPIHEWQSAWSLPLTFPTLPKVLAQASPWPISTSAIGKWHLGTVNNGGDSHPNLMGFQYFAGLLGNLNFGADFYNYPKIVNGVTTTSTTYATTDQVNDAIARIGVMPEPWFLYLGFSAAHIPFHAPPANLHHYNLAGNPDLTPADHYRATVEAMDTEIGRLMQSMSPAVRARTTVVFIGDNGSVKQAVLPPLDPAKSKGTLYEGGIRVPLIISGNQVEQPGSRCYALVHAVDVFPTSLELLGVPASAADDANNPVDGYSLMDYLERPWAPSQRTWVYAERFDPNGPPPYASAGFMVRDARWKFIDRGPTGDQFFDLASGAPDPEDTNLLDYTLTPEQAANYARMQRLLKDVLR